MLYSLVDTFNSRSQTLLCNSTFNNWVNAGLDGYTHTHTEFTVHCAEQVFRGKMVTQEKQKNWVEISVLWKDMRLIGILFQKIEFSPISEARIWP